jgi:hypothetical protein
VKAGADTSVLFESIEHPSGVRHHGEFVVSAGERLYTTTYLPTTAPKLGVVFCPSWGIEAGRQMGWTQRFAHDLAARGAATALVQWPGTEDSEGDATAVTLDRLVEAGVDTANAVRSRCSPPRWCVVGTRIGGAPAALVAAAMGASHLVLVQPELDLAAHFAELDRQSRRGRLGAELPADWAFGHPSPPGLRREEDRGRVVDAVQSFGRRAAVVHYRRTDIPHLPSGVRHTRVWGQWTDNPNVEHLSLRAGAMKTVLRSTRGRA